MSSIIQSDFDSLVMLTWSDWFTELRSNRYHYATRFAKSTLVIFIQPDLEKPEYKYEDSGIENLFILHVYCRYDSEQSALINNALLEKNIIRPIFWIYNCNFQNVVQNRFSVLNIYHATEDYLSSDSRIKIVDNNLLTSLNNILNCCQLLIAVSDGVKNSYLEASTFKGTALTVTNGCDFQFYRPSTIDAFLTNKSQRDIIFYQGNIFDKLNFKLLNALALEMPSWTFQFCGKVPYNDKNWLDLCKLPNVEYIGVLTPEEIRLKAYESTVGIIPFVESEWIIERSFPLKTFEYLACGLPVVTVPIRSILPFSDVLDFASTVEEFKSAILSARDKRMDLKLIEMRLNSANLQDYDKKFEAIILSINKELSKKVVRRVLNIAVLYEPASTHVGTIADHLNSFSMYSRHEISYIPATQGIHCQTNLSYFDVIIIHYSIRVSMKSGNYMLSPSYIKSLKEYGGYKILFVQDEYEETETARKWITELGFHCVYTCVPKAYIEDIYPYDRFPFVRFINTLTGFVPMNRPDYHDYPPTVLREKWVGYRGRNLPFWYGTLGHEKYYIGERFKELCSDINIDIETDASMRIYGSSWYDFLGNCRATLGTESGANIFDDNGDIRRAIEKLSSNHNITFEEICDSLILPNEKIKMNQISPKVFEAISLKTALILFEGEYSGVLMPNKHYILLKKDFSNFADVLNQLSDNNLIDEMVSCAYKDIISSDTYSYMSFIKNFDEDVSQDVAKFTPIIKPAYFALAFVKQSRMDFNYNLKKLTTLPAKQIFTLTEVSLYQSTYTFKYLNNNFKYLKKLVLKFIPNSVKSKIKNKLEKMGKLN